MSVREQIELYMNTARNFNIPIYLFLYRYKSIREEKSIYLNTYYPIRVGI